MPQNPPIIAGTRIGHVHLKVADLDRALGFYCGVLGFELQQRMGSGAAFISAGGYHHHIGLNTWESRGGSPPPMGPTGLYPTPLPYPPPRAPGPARASTTPPSATPRGGTSGAPSGGCWRPGSSSRGPRTTGSARRSTWPIRTRTASSSTGT